MERGVDARSVVRVECRCFSKRGAHRIAGAGGALPRSGGAVERHPAGAFVDDCNGCNRHDPARSDTFWWDGSWRSEDHYGPADAGRIYVRHRPAAAVDECARDIAALAAGRRLAGKRSETGHGRRAVPVGQVDQRARCTAYGDKRHNGAAALQERLSDRSHRPASRLRDSA